MGEFEQVKPYTQAELNQQAIWANEFDQWWESEGQYHRAGGNEYCRTFAWWAWLNREQWQQSKIEQLEKEKAELHNKIKSQIELLEEVSKSSIAYNEREKNILKSQADDLERILRGECG